VYLDLKRGKNNKKQLGVTGGSMGSSTIGHFTSESPTDIAAKGVQPVNRIEKSNIMIQQFSTIHKITKAKFSSNNMAGQKTLD
jgi:hypothetical protein